MRQVFHRRTASAQPISRCRVAKCTALKATLKQGGLLFLSERALAAREIDEDGKERDYDNNERNREDLAFAVGNE